MPFIITLFHNVHSICYTPPGDLFGQAEMELPPLTGVTRENYLSRLREVACPKCGSQGRFLDFGNGPHVGLICTACGREHPLRARGLMWLPREDNDWRRRNP